MRNRSIRTLLLSVITDGPRSGKPHSGQQVISDDPRTGHRSGVAKLVPLAES